MSAYHAEFESMALRAFSQWNREPASPSFGCFDRSYWGWKKKDFSDATLQYAVRLAVEYAVEVGGTHDLPALLEGYISYCRSIQRRDGSFDQCYPYERTPGVVYDFLSTLIYVRQSPFLTSERARATLDGCIERAVGFALRTDEKHGEIANHLAEYAYEILFAGAWLNLDAARRKGEYYLERTLKLFCHEEGWFREYNGPDAGYQTRTLRYLAKCARLLNDGSLWQVVERAAQFVEQLLMPDGSLHPMLGVRSTALLYPSAFETLGAMHPRFAPLAARVRRAWDERRVPMPSWLDFENGIRLADDAYDAWRTTQGAPPPEVSLAFESSREELPRAGITIYRDPSRVVYVGSALGGVVVAYAADRDGRWRLALEDSGYLMRDGASAWLTRAPQAGVRQDGDAEGVTVQVDFSRSLHDELTPERFIVLRLLNLTLLRWDWFAELFRKIVVRRLMTARETASVSLTREVQVTADTVAIRDRLRGRAGRRRLWRCRRLVGIHMASSRYFQPQELAPTPPGWMQEIEWHQQEEGELSQEFTLPRQIGSAEDRSPIES